MVNKPQDFLTLTGAARRARSEGYDITYHSLRTYSTPIWLACFRMVSRLNRAWITSSPAPATNPTVCSRRHLDAGGIF